jgi:hypothetical protein
MMERQPKNIFEQILFGLEATNINVVAVSEELAAMWRDIKAIKAALYIEDSEPNALGAVENETVEGNNTQQL